MGRPIHGWDYWVVEEFRALQAFSMDDKSVMSIRWSCALCHDPLTDRSPGIRQGRCDRQKRAAIGAICETGYIPWDQPLHVSSGHTPMRLWS